MPYDRVPKGLYHELTEYASLLRALRTRDTLDVTKHIMKSSPFELSKDDGTKLAPGDDDSLSITSAHAPPSTSASAAVSRTASLEPSSSSKRKGEQTESQKKKRKRARTTRDQWTLWPLMTNDMPKPEWTFEDEVAVVASQVEKSFARDTPIEYDDTPEDCVYVDLEHDEDDPDPPFYVHHLTGVVAEYLAAVLASLESQVPLRSASMTDRIEALGWREVIDAAVDCGNSRFVNPEVIEKVVKRMKSMYGLKEDYTLPMARINKRLSFSKAVDDQFSNVDYLTQADPPDELDVSSLKGPTFKENLELKHEDKEFHVRKATRTRVQVQGRRMKTRARSKGKTTVQTPETEGTEDELAQQSSSEEPNASGALP